MNYPCAPGPLDGERGDAADRLQAVGLGMLITSHCHLAGPPHLLGVGASACLPLEETV